MDTTAVNSAAPPAATDRPSEEFSVQDSLNQASPDDLKKWQLTGELPTRREMPVKAEAAATSKQKEEPGSGTEGETAAPAPDNAADSATASTQQRKEHRWQKRERELREARAEIARLQADRAAPAARSESSQASPPAPESATTAPPRPRIDEVDPKTGKPKYESYDAYENARDTWLKNEAIREFREQSAKSEQQKAQEAKFAEIGKNIATKFEAAAAKHPDFKTVVHDDLLIPMGSVVDGFIQDSDEGGEVAYYLGQHPAILEEFYGDFDLKTGRFTNKVSPQRQFRRLMEIEAEVGGAETQASAAPPKVPPKLPAPPTTLGARNSAAVDDAEAALAKGDTQAYMRIMNQRDLHASRR